MTTLLRRANENTQSIWLPVPEGLFRWIVGVPTLKLSEQYGKYQVAFPMTLTKADQDRVKDEVGEAAEGEMQSWRATYNTGLSLGWFKDGAYQSTKMVDFLAFCLGTGNTKDFRKWISTGGGPPRPEDKDDDQAELEAIGEWLKWWENLEIYGTIRHEDDKKDPGKKWARFGGPMPVGSLPGQKDEDYQALARGKLRLIKLESGETRVSGPVAGADSPPAEQYTAAGQRVTTPPDDDPDELPF